MKHHWTDEAVAVTDMMEPNCWNGTWHSHCESGVGTLICDRGCGHWYTIGQALPDGTLITAGDIIRVKAPARDWVGTMTQFLNRDYSRFFELE